MDLLAPLPIPKAALAGHCNGILSLGCQSLKVSTPSAHSSADFPRNITTFLAAGVRGEMSTEETHWILLWNVCGKKGHSEDVCRMKKRHQENDNNKESSKKESSNKDSSSKDKPKSKDNASEGRCQIPAAAINVDMNALRPAIRGPTSHSAEDVSNAYHQSKYDSTIVSTTSLTKDSAPPDNNAKLCYSILNAPKAFLATLDMKNSGTKTYATG